MNDHQALVPALDALEKREIAPEEMFADTTYNSGDNLIAAAAQGVEFMASTPDKTDPDGIGLGHFDLDLKELRVCACPEGARPIRSRLGKDQMTRNLRFDPERCAICPLTDDCPAGKQGGRLRVHPRDIATVYSRVREESETFKKAYAIRAGSNRPTLSARRPMDWARCGLGASFGWLKRFLRYSCARILGNVLEMVQNAA
ncbi:MAG: transposase [Magnetococcales bacterium]|nr:transposase [Magnetococcales bacterium]